MRYRHWTVYNVTYVARRPDQRVEVGDSNSFEASTQREVVEKLRTRGIDPTTDPDVEISMVEHLEVTSLPVSVHPRSLT